MKLHELKNVKGAIHRKKRVGCGEGGGHGKTSGRGGKGQTARSGGSIRPGFEGGQMPLYRKLPRRGFNQAQFRTEAAVVNLDDLKAIADDITEINAQVFADNGLLRKDETYVKVLGNGEITRALKITASKFSASAKEKIEKAGGEAIVA
ncbi:MAG: 50S ribosomal protein L15 [Opitutaceae bacterium]|jgi:large subunit ribosomal protein L15|nr:50S ribosomal protein L15 [Opitutaceae bacterium]|tara:strand:- start:6046 stop:6492 length:447 start_codon:yes stop_codon:yes gene_type:complete